MQKRIGVMVFLVAACGGGSSTPDAALPDTRMPDAAPCNTIANVATDVMEMAIGQIAPTPAGGTLVDGTYVVSAATLYTGTGGPSGATGMVYRATSIDTGGSYTYVDSAGGQLNATSGSYSTSGTDDITVIQLCPTFGALTYQKYSASPTEFTLFDVSNPAVRSLTFTKQ